MHQKIVMMEEKQRDDDAAMKRLEKEMANHTELHQATMVSHRQEVGDLNSIIKDLQDHKLKQSEMEKVCSLSSLLVPMSKC